MTLATFEAGGVQPSRQDPFARLFQRIVSPGWVRANWRGTVAALQVGGAAVAALGAVLAPHAAKAPMPAPAPAPAAAAASVPTTITPQVLIGQRPGLADATNSKQMLQALMTKAGLRPDFGLRHLTWDQARKLNALMPDAHAPLQTPAPFSLALDTSNGREALTCLTQTAYYEAGGNGPDAEAAVVQVVLNRVRHPDFPKSVCGVVYQGSERETGCQFTFTCDGAMTRPVDKASWNEARKVAARALSGYVVKAVGASTFYHANYVFPAWAPTLAKIATVGPHIFYSVAGAEGAILTGRYAGGELKVAQAILRATTQKPDRGVPDRIQMASLQAKGTQVPAGLMAQADRLQRVHAVLAAGRGVDERSEVETASAQPAAAQAADAPITTAPTPTVQTPSA